MDVVDIVLIVVVAGAAIHGLRVGALVQVLTFGGFLVGLTLGSLLAVHVLESVHSGTTKTALTLLMVLGLAFVLAGAGGALGSWSHATARRWHLGPIDGLLGVGVAVVAVLVSVWLVANLLAQSRFTWLDAQIQGSDVVKLIDNDMPPVPSVFGKVQSFLTSSGFPPVFAHIPPLAAGPVPVPSLASADAIAERATGSTVKVLGQACGYLQEGSAFVVAPGMVVTNAHVVAGEPSTRIQVGGITYGATPVLVTPTFDIAVLRTHAPIGPALTLDPDDVGRGTSAAVVGYPEDGPLVVRPGGVAASLTAEGRNIYGQGYVVRRVYQIDADVEPGNSGGPLVASDGEVVGVVFSRSTVTADVGYALASPGVLSRVEQAEHREAPVSTGACTES